MALINAPVLLSKASQDGLLQLCIQTHNAAFQTIPLRTKFEYLDKEYYRENIITIETLKAKQGNMLGDKRMIQDVVMPVLDPQIETAVSFLASVFLTGQPIFGVAYPPDQIAQGKAMEALISENSIRGGWVSEFLKFFRDGYKYNFQAVEITWDRQTTFNPVIDTTVSTTKPTPKEVIWEGNCIKRIDPYNTFYDPRVFLVEQHKKAEFVGYVELVSRMYLKMYIENLSNSMNVAQAFASGTNLTGELYYIPKVQLWENFEQNKLRGLMDWNLWAFGEKSRLDYKNIYQLVTRYVRIIPSDFQMKVPKPNTPQIWKLVTVNDQVIINCERQTNAHNYLPIIFGQPNDTGLGFQDKSLAQKLISIQDLASASWNARLQIERRKVSDRGIYDPSRIKTEDINSPNSAAKIPVRPTAYGKDVKEAYHSIPFEDNSSGSFVQDANEFAKFGNMLSGQNPAQQGQFVKGNKTQQEFDDTMNQSSGRQRTSALNIECQVMTPLKEIIKLNILQYQGDGQVYHPADQKPYPVNMIDIRKAALPLKMSDGLTPTEKLINTQTLQMAMQTIGQSEELQQQYKLGPLFTYTMSLAGADLSPFEYTPQELQQRQQQQQAQQMAMLKAQAAAKAGVNPQEEAAEGETGTPVPQGA